MSSKTTHSKLANKPELYYTNEDVAILYDIVLHAEELLGSLSESEKIPTNALFHAYYAILPTIGIDADHDNRYARVIFKIGGRRGGGSLFKNFENVLSEMGIEIQFDQVDGEGHHTLHKLPEDSSFDKLPKPDFNLVERPMDKKRRNSESSVWTVGDGRVDDISQRPRSNSFESQPYTGFFSNNHHQSILPNRPLQTFNLSVSKELVGRENSAHGIGSWLSEEVDGNDQLIPSQSSSPEQRLQERIISHGNARNEGDASGVLFDTDAQSLETLEKNVDIPQQESGIHELLDPVATSKTQARVGNAKSRNFLPHLQSRSTLSHVLECWRQKAAQILVRNSNLDALARDRDRYVLLRQGIETWVTTVYERRRIRETERFFLHLESRAKRARDIFLVAKAFTHWATTTSDGIQRTSVARRHILRTRFFKAWQEVTAVNELKVRRHILKKCFNSWRRRCVAIRVYSERSMAMYHRNIASIFFYLWFWSFRESRAPIWWADRSKTRQIAAWTTKLQTIREIDTVAQYHYQRKLKKLVWDIWVGRAGDLTDMKDASTLMHKRSCCINALRYMHTAHILRPSLRQMELKVKYGLSINILNIWHLRATQERQAGNLDCHKVKKEAWIAWRYKTRCQTMQLRIKDKNILQGLYKWVLAERLILARRVSNQKIIRASLECMLLTSTKTMDSTTPGVETALWFRDQNDKRLVLHRWGSKLKIHRNLQSLAIQRSSIAIQLATLRIWIKNMNNLRQLQAWAIDANFYFVMTKVLGAWQDATQTSQREKRRAAYASVRRQSKLRLASRVLHIWTQQSKSMTDMENIVSEICGNRTVNCGVNALARWRARKDEVLRLGTIRLRSLLKVRYIQWKSSSENFYHLDIVAGTSYEDRLRTSSTKKWGRLALQLRAHQHLVSELHEKHARRVVRKIILHWRQQLFDHESSRFVSLGTEGVREYKRSGLGFMEGAEAYSELGVDSGLDHLSHRSGGFFATAAEPGYLKTPSKRISFARAANQLSTTPKAPLSTPYEKQLRAQLSGRLTYSRMSTDNSNNSNEEFEDLKR